MGAYGNRPGIIFDWFMIVMILTNVVAVAAQTVPEIGERYADAFFIFELVSIIIFSTEYLLRLWVAVEGRSGSNTSNWRIRLKYALSPLAIIDLLAILPFFLLFFSAPDLRFLRIFRLLRLLKLVRYSPALVSLARVIYDERRALIATLIIMLGAMFLASSVMYFVERGAQPEAFGSIPQALWWAVTTLTTVGYGDVVPITAQGRVVGGMVMIFGLAFYAIPIGIVASSFSNEIHRRDFVVRYGILAKVPLFVGLDPETIVEVGRMLRSIVVEEGVVISHRGQSAEGLYFLISGEAEARFAGRVISLPEGGFFGEISLLKDTFKEVTVVARVKCRLMLLESHDFQHLLVIRPEVKNRLDHMVEGRLQELLASNEITADEREAIWDRHCRRYGEPGGQTDGPEG